MQNIVYDYRSYVIARLDRVIQTGAINELPLQKPATLTAGLSRRPSIISAYGRTRNDHVNCHGHPVETHDDGASRQKRAAAISQPLFALYKMCNF